MPGTRREYGHAYAALKVASVNAQAAVLLHWAATTESSEAAAAAEAEGEDNQRPAFVETVVGGLVSQIAQVS